jgi:hypothetical protein
MSVRQSVSQSVSMDIPAKRNISVSDKSGNSAMQLEDEIC